MKRFLKDNGLSLVMFGLFLVFGVLQSVTGLHNYNANRQQHGHSKVSYGRYLVSGAFIEALFENWESEFLQMGSFVFLTSFLRQKGAADSRREGGEPELDADPEANAKPDSPRIVRRGGLAVKVYSHSLTLALLGLFVFSFLMHAVGGRLAYNEEAQDHGQPPTSLLAFLGTSTFWFQSFQNWQSEFLSVGVMLVLSIWLRQRGSTESKPVHAPHSQTGD